MANVVGTLCRRASDELRFWGTAASHCESCMKSAQFIPQFLSEVKTLPNHFKIVIVLNNGNFKFVLVVLQKICKLLNATHVNWSLHWTSGQVTHVGQLHISACKNIINTGGKGRHWMDYRQKTCNSIDRCH